MKKIAALSAILANPAQTQSQFNAAVSDYQEIVKGRLGIPFDDKKAAAISIIAYAEEDIIIQFTDRLSAIDGVSVNTAIY
ncbi:MAG: iron-only hydrogenase system regulator [Clostridia bacterium]|nr:iron-only hydrogenase system regulator [Clostridia bacterium]